jgi:hypothetical protein
MKGLVLLTITICLSTVGFSQADFRKGYVITNERDTLFGLVDYKVGTRPYKWCDFKEIKSQKITTYQPGEIVGYGFVFDKFFESREVLLLPEPSKLVFFEVIVSGTVSLYKYEQNYFVEKNDEGLHKLTNEYIETVIDGKSVFKNTNQHIITLNMLLSDCGSVSARNQKASLSEKYLTSLIEKYNTCKGTPTATYKNKKVPVRSKFGIYAGVNISQLDFVNKNAGYDHLDGSFDSPNSPAIGVSLDISSPRINERLSFHIGIQYFNSEYNRFSQEDNGTKTTHSTFKMQQVKIPLGIQYTFGRKDFSPFIAIGMSGTAYLSSDFKVIQEVEFNNTTEVYKYDGSVPKNNQIGIWGGCGILKSISKKLDASLELRYELTNGIDENVDPEVDSKITNFQILVGIRMK